MDVNENLKEKLVDLLDQFVYDDWYGNGDIAEKLIANGVTVQESAYWQYIDDDVDEDNNIQAYCSACGAGDKHAINMIGKVPYCWRCGRKMTPQPQKEE